MLADPKTVVLTFLIVSIIKHPSSGYLIYRDRYFIYGPNNPSFIIFRIALLLSFSGFWENEILPLARYTLRSPLQAPAYLAHRSAVSLSLLDTSRVPNPYRLQSSRITQPSNGTVPFDSSNYEVT